MRANIEEDRGFFGQSLEMFRDLVLISFRVDVPVIVGDQASLTAHKLDGNGKFGKAPLVNIQDALFGPSEHKTGFNEANGDAIQNRVAEHNDFAWPPPAACIF